MAGAGKRKDAPTGAGQNGGKKKKTGNANKWMTPNHQAKQLDSLKPGDRGIWVTCHRHKEDRALKEISTLFSEYAEKLYGIKEEAEAAEGDDDDDDIAASIQKELDALNAKGKKREQRIFHPMKMNVDCLLFFRVKAPVDPVELVKRICDDAKNSTDSTLFKCRFVNRLTPVTVIGKANESGLLKVARKTLSPYFKLNAPQTKAAPDGSEDEEKSESESEPAEEDQKETPEIKPSTFAIRPTIRNHTILKRDWVIQQAAGLVDQELHKVNLTTPENVILIDIFQTVCGMSVVGSDWEELKRYNLAEIYAASAKEASTASTTEPKDSGS